MEFHSGQYALVQYGPSSERQEFLNVGVVLLVPDQRFADVRLSEKPPRIERAFGKAGALTYSQLKWAFEARVKLELGERPSFEGFEQFALRRANVFRISKLQSIMVKDKHAGVILDVLLRDQVGDARSVQREPRIRTKMRNAFAQRGVAHLLNNPPPIDLPEFGVKVNVPFGYQNGVYNLVDGLRLAGDVGSNLREAGKRAIEGSFIWRHYQHEPVQRRLVVVGDFANQSDAFYRGIAERLADANVKLHRLDDIDMLIGDIERNAKLQPTISQ